jgi:hypothetical protein
MNRLIAKVSVHTEKGLHAIVVDERYPFVKEKKGKICFFDDKLLLESHPTEGTYIYITEQEEKSRFTIIKNFQSLSIQFDYEENIKKRAFRVYNQLMMDGQRIGKKHEIFASSRNIHQFPLEIQHAISLFEDQMKYLQRREKEKNELEMYLREIYLSLENMVPLSRIMQDYRHLEVAIWLNPTKTCFVEAQVGESFQVKELPLNCEQYLYYQVQTI